MARACPRDCTARASSPSASHCRTERRLRPPCPLPPDPAWHAGGSADARYRRRSTRHTERCRWCRMGCCSLGSDALVRVGARCAHATQPRGCWSGVRRRRAPDSCEIVNRLARRHDCTRSGICWLVTRAESPWFHHRIAGLCDRQSCCDPPYREIDLACPT